MNPIGQQSELHAYQRITRWFWAFLVAHIIVWTLVPSLTAPNHTLDALEMATWGREWQLGYYKHPPLPAWIGRGLTVAFGNSTMPLYAAAALMSGACLWAAFALGRRVAGAAAGLAAAVALEACHYYSFTSIEFNNNIVSRTFAAVAVVFVHRGMTSRRTIDWSIAGVMLGLGLLAKYDVAVLAIVLLAYSLIRSEPRKNWRTPGPYAMLATSALVFAPHLLWAVSNDFPTLEYAARRSTPAESILDHFTRPASFAVSQLAAVIPILAVIYFTLRRRVTSVSVVPSPRVSKEDEAFVFTIAIGTFALIVSVAVLTGAGVRSMWGSSLWTFAGLAIVLLLHRLNRIEFTLPSLERTMRVAAVTGLLMAIVIGARYQFGPELRGKASRVHFPGKALAEVIENSWDAVSEDPLPIVVGEHWITGNVSYSGRDNAAMYIDGMTERSPWLDDSELRTRGGVIVWRDVHPMDEVLARFPEARPVESVDLPFAGHPSLQPVAISYAVIPPAAVIASGQRETRVR